MPWFGIGLLALTLALSASTGWPTYAVVLGVSAFGLMVSWSVGGIDPGWAGSLGARVVGLLEADLLQALALYALAGALLHHLGVADAVYRGLARAIARRAPGSANGTATLLLGALMAPLNGSVGASVHGLSRLTADPRQPPAPDAARALALVAVAGTLGAVVPPSVVLLLLGDAMLRAHTEGLNLARQMAWPLAGQGVRVMNTQDLLQAVLVPGALLFTGWLALSWRRGRAGDAPAAPSRDSGSKGWLLFPLAVGALLLLVGTGRVRAVEGAATFTLGLLVWGWLSGRLRRAMLGAVLDDALSLTGSLFALLVAATTLSLLLRALGTDGLVQRGMMGLQGHEQLAVGAVLAGLLACSFVLDAYELIFLVVPIVMPPLLAQVGDAAWVATLALLVLQLGFLLPPWGMAVVLARTHAAGAVRLRPLARALAPYIGWSLVTTAVVFAWPACTTWLRTAPATVTERLVAPEDVERTLREMSAPRQP